ncbi:MAG TPA: hypothetical protein VGY48_15305 [Vicinamibacterales bacterium]|nr:hypothetical protein [Vicinamibacterales bacterium]
MAKKGIPPTVCNFQTVLTSKLTQYDQRQEKAALKRGHSHSIYALGHYLKAAEKVEADVKRAAPDCNVTMTPEIASTMRTALRRHFTDGFPPAQNVTKQIDAFLTTGKEPSLLGRARRRR